MDSHDSEEVTNVIISDEADVILYKYTEYVYHISTKLLSETSPVFRAMFGPNFAEGQAVLRSDESSLPMIELPDDNNLALESLLSILHGRDMGLVADTITANQIWKVTRLADKYDCLAAVASLSSSLFEPLNIKSTSSEYDSNCFHNAKLLYAAYRLDNAEYFQKYTNALVKMGEYDMLEDTNTLKISRIKQLHERERECRNFLDGKVAELAGHITPFLFRKQPPHGVHGEQCKASVDSDTHCLYHRRFASRYLEYLGKELLYPIPPSTATFGDLFNDLLQKQTHTFKGLRQIEGLERPDLADINHCELTPSCGLSEFRCQIDPKIQELKACVRTMWAGLCLDCLKHPDNVDMACRVQHGPFTLMRDMRASKKRKRVEESDGEDEDGAEPHLATTEDGEWEDVESGSEDLDDDDE